MAVGTNHYRTVKQVEENMVLELLVPRNGDLTGECSVVVETCCKLGENGVPRSLSEDLSV